MSWHAKIDSKKYITGTAINLLFALYAGAPEPRDCGILVFMIISVALNHYYTVQVFAQLIQSRLTQDSGSKRKLALYLLLKTVFLLLGFLSVLVFASNKVLHGLVLYIFQLIILFLSIKNIGQFLKKGSPS